VLARARRVITEDDARLVPTSRSKIGRSADDPSAFAPQDFQCRKRGKEPAMNTTIENIPTVRHDQAGFHR
jgi:hypothetical protein